MFSKHGELPALTDLRVRLIVGLFQDTLYPFLAEYQRGDRVVVHIDCDLYSSTLFCLTAIAVCVPGMCSFSMTSMPCLTNSMLSWTTRDPFYRVLQPLASLPYCEKVAFMIGSRQSVGKEAHRPLCRAFGRGDRLVTDRVRRRRRELDHQQDHLRVDSEQGRSDSTSRRRLAAQRSAARRLV
jgi:hypothetical protein